MTVLAQRDKVRVAAFNKCGNSSIINTFMSTPESVGHVEEMLFTPKVLNTADAAKKVGGYRGDFTNCHDWPKPDVVVAFVRNPAYRVLSAYQHFVIRTMRYKFKDLGFTQGMPFDKFVDHLLTVDLTTDKHLTPQIDDLVAASGDELCNYILAPLEMIGEAWPIVMDNVGLGNVVPRIVLHLNRGNYNPADFMTSELHDKLRELYSQDYNLWEVICDETREEISSISDATH
jgi:hypothetical protein